MDASKTFSVKAFDDRLGGSDCEVLSKLCKHAASIARIQWPSQRLSRSPSSMLLRSLGSRLHCPFVPSPIQKGNPALRSVWVGQRTDLQRPSLRRLSLKTACACMIREVLCVQCNARRGWRQHLVSYMLCPAQPAPSRCSSVLNPGTRRHALLRAICGTSAAEKLQAENRPGF